MLDDLDRDFYSICVAYGGTPEYASHHLFSNKYLICKNADLKRITSGWGIESLLRKIAYTLDELEPVPPMKTRLGVLPWSSRSIFFRVVDGSSGSYIEARMDKNTDGTLKVEEEIKVGGSILFIGDQPSTEDYISNVMLKNLKPKLKDMKMAGLRGKCESTSLFEPSIYCEFSSKKISPEAIRIPSTTDVAKSTGNLVAEIIRLLPTP